MSNEVYPTLPGLTFGTETEFAFATEVQRNVSGRRVGQALRSTPLRTWTLNYDVVRETAGKTEMSTLLGFWFRHYGNVDSFLFEDPKDKTATNQLAGLGNGSWVAFQLRRWWGTFAEPIQNPNVVSAVRVNNVTVNPANYSVNASTGVLTLSTPPANGHAVEFDATFYFRAAFAENTLSLTEFVKLFFETRRLKLEQVLT